MEECIQQEAGRPLRQSLERAGRDGWEGVGGGESEFETKQKEEGAYSREG